MFTCGVKGLNDTLKSGILSHEWFQSKINKV